MKESKSKLCAVAVLVFATVIVACVARAATPINDAPTASARDTNTATLIIPFRLETDESNAALLGRQCAVIWFASESKVFKEGAMDKDILAATAVAKALGVSYSEEQFRNTFGQEKTKAAGDFDSLFPEKIKTEKGERIRDIYLFSYWCTAARDWVSLVPLWKEPEKQDVARRWVAVPLAKAKKVASIRHSDIASACEGLGIRSLSDPLDTFDATDKFADKVLKVQKDFLLKYLTEDQVAMVTQPLLKRKR